MSFGGFWCPRCGGRVFEDDPYTDGNGKKMAVLTCLYCARNYQCSYRDYLHLLRNIEEIVEKRAKNHKRKFLSKAK